MRVSRSPLHLKYMENPPGAGPKQRRQVDDVPASGPEPRKVRFLQNSQSDPPQRVQTADPSSQRPYRSCVHLELPPHCSSSVVFLDKPLFITLGTLEGGGGGGGGGARAHQYRSTASIQILPSPCRRPVAGAPPARTQQQIYRKPREHASVSERAAAAGQSSRVQRVPGGPRSATAGSHTHRHTQRGSSAANVNAGARKEPEEEAAQLRLRHAAAAAASRNLGSGDEKDEEQRGGTPSREIPKVKAVREDETRCGVPQLKVDTPDGERKNLSLREALELFRPDFISRSQGRVRRLEQRARRRRALQGSNPDVAQSLREDGGKQRRRCTTPDPLSDNLFKPAERSISGREMQLRSRRMYNKLPEVTKKKEQEQKRAVSQTNRLRVEVFKKRLLEQVLQR